MPTGACGINCDVCKLRLLGACSTCGSGKSKGASRKLAAQERIFGGTCAILECARMNALDYCMRDCNEFPCENHRIGPYPYGESFLRMQARRLSERPPARNHNNQTVTVPSEYWDALGTRDLTELSNLTLFAPHPPPPRPPRGLIFTFLHEPIRVDVAGRCLRRRSEGGGWDRTDDPLLELVTLVYLNAVTSFYPLAREIVGPLDLKEGHFFKGPHVLKIEPLLERYGEDLEGFIRAARYLGGESVDMADAAFRLLPFPRVPLYYLLWRGDAEFPPRLSVLFDRSIERVFAADALWGLVSRVSTGLLVGPSAGFSGGAAPVS